MIIEIKPEETGGEILIPPSKSYSHRAVFAASLANGTSKIENIIMSNDIRASIEACKALGAEIIAEPGEDGLFTLMITGTPDPGAENCFINCEESGSTVRMLIPIVAIDADNAVITGEGRLVERPLSPIVNCLSEKGVEFESGDKQLPLIITGKLESGTFRLPGNISSQFVTGLLFALPLLEGDSVIELDQPPESKPYIDMTIGVLETFGVEVKQVSPTRYEIEGGQSYKPNRYVVEGDFSQGAFFLVNGAVNKKTVLKGLPETSIQGDSAIIGIMKDAGCRVYYDKEKSAWVSEPSDVKAFSMDARQAPDLVPPVSVLAALSGGTCEITGAGRLRIKESDRLRALHAMLKAFGVDVDEHMEGLTIKGQKSLDSCTVDSFGDHRIAMSAAVASGRAIGPVIVEKADAVSKSWPSFWDDFEDLGGKIEVR